MAKILNCILLVIVSALAVKSEALETLQDNINEKYASYNKNPEQLVNLFKKDSLKVLCENGKINPTWCQYKQLLEINAHEKQRKMVARRSASRICWPGLPYDCKGLVPARLARAAATENEHDTSNDDQKREAAMKCRPGMANCRRKGKRGMAKVSQSEYDTNIDEQKREAAMKCRPGMANCRRKGKREFEAQPKPNDCPQGWLFCL